MYASQSMANNVHPEHSLGVGMKSGGERRLLRLTLYPYSCQVSVWKVRPSHDKYIGKFRI